MASGDLTATAGRSITTSTNTDSAALAARQSAVVESEAAAEAAIEAAFPVLPGTTTDPIAWTRWEWTTKSQYSLIGVRHVSFSKPAAAVIQRIYYTPGSVPYGPSDPSKRASAYPNWIIEEWLQPDGVSKVYKYAHRRVPLLLPDYATIADPSKRYRRTRNGDILYIEDHTTMEGMGYLFANARILHPERSDEDCLIFAAIAFQSYNAEDGVMEFPYGYALSKGPTYGTYWEIIDRARAEGSSTPTEIVNIIGQWAAETHHEMAQHEIDMSHFRRNVELFVAAGLLVVCGVVGFTLAAPAAAGTAAGTAAAAAPAATAAAPSAVAGGITAALGSAASAAGAGLVTAGTSLLTGTSGQNSTATPTPTDTTTETIASEDKAAATIGGIVAAIIIAAAIII